LPLVELPRFTREEKYKSMCGDVNVANGPATLTSDSKSESKPARVTRDEKYKSMVGGMNVAGGPATLTSESKRESKPVVEKKGAKVQLRKPTIEKKASRVQLRQPSIEEKKAAKEERRRFRRSEDFLGVQGANPITGTWDSDPTSTTEQMSEETQKRVDDPMKELVEAKKRVEEAQKLFQETLQRIQALRDVKKEEKGQEKLAEKMRRRRGERWRLTETGWTSTELSPIAQSPGEYRNKC
jgi:hypothetical protein